MSSAPHKIDIHAHYLPEPYREALLASQDPHARADGIPVVPPWDPDTHLRIMDELFIRKSYLSISSPGVHFGDDADARALARACNQAGAQLALKHPTRLAFFATLPLPDIDGALIELAQAFEEGASGVCLLTNTHGLYLGDRHLDPLFSALDSRPGGAVVVLHPTTPCAYDTGNPVHMQKYFSPLIEFPMDTARAVVQLLLSGTVARYQNIRWVIPHAGGALPSVLDRVLASTASEAVRALNHIDTDVSRIPQLVKEKFYYDLAGTPFPHAIKGLMQYAGPDRIMYGSDYPWASEASVKTNLKQIDENVEKIWGEVEGAKEQIDYRTAEDIFSGSVPQV